MDQGGMIGRISGDIFFPENDNAAWILYASGGESNRSALMDAPMVVCHAGDWLAGSAACPATNADVYFATDDVTNPNSSMPSHHPAAARLFSADIDMSDCLSHDDAAANNRAALMARPTLWHTPEMPYPSFDASPWNADACYDNIDFVELFQRTQDEACVAAALLSEAAAHGLAVLSVGGGMTATAAVGGGAAVSSSSSSSSSVGEDQQQRPPLSPAGASKVQHAASSNNNGMEVM
mmetsp:Transcript_24904/g.61363  ORF Transcript_24904/g.61363 Transcript_24904/m.61363 type:complete len:236 (+) Transcript_24904:155-862(+)